MPTFIATWFEFLVIAYIFRLINEGHLEVAFRMNVRMHPESLGPTDCQSAELINFVSFLY